MEWFIVCLCALAALVIGLAGGYVYRKRIAEAKTQQAEEAVRKMIDEAQRRAEALKKETLLETKEEVHQLRSDLDREMKERRSELQRSERRLIQKEESLDRKLDAAEKKEQQLNNGQRDLQKRRDELEVLFKKQLDDLERISGMSREEAKEVLISSIEGDARHDAALLVREIEQKAKEEGEKRARNIIGLAIQRCAADHVAESTVSVVHLPSDDMKGRIIGREGRNIRALETATGIDLIIDDTPEAITISCFDQVRREVARIALEKLIQDGRIHPTRIEEMVEKAKREVELKIKQEGERAILETNVHGVNHELVKLLGRLRYRTSYRQNVLNHSIEVAHLAGMMASELGVDANLARRAGLLHDIGKALSYEIEGSHVQIGVDVCKKYKESPEVIHAIEAHHGDVETRTVVAALVQAADAISAARPGARSENYENYIKRLQKLEEICTSYEGVEKSFAIQAGREVRIMVQPEKINDEKMVLVAREIAKRIETEMDYPGQIKVNVVRETRAVDYAK